jgi:hypothetical protein
LVNRAVKMTKPGANQALKDYIDDIKVEQKVEILENYNLIDK